MFQISRVICKRHPETKDSQEQEKNLGLVFFCLAVLVLETGISLPRPMHYTQGPPPLVHYSIYVTKLQSFWILVIFFPLQMWWNDYQNVSTSPAELNNDTKFERFPSKVSILTKLLE